MQNELRNKMSKTIVEFRKAAGSEELSAEKPNYINLCNTLDLLKSSKFMEFNCSLPMLILRGKKRYDSTPKSSSTTREKIHQC